MNDTTREEHTVLFWKSTADDIVHTWPLMNSSNDAVMIITAYLFIVKYFGPLYMKNRKAYTLKIPLIIYNIGQVIISTYLVYFALYVGIPFMDFFSPVCHHRVDVTEEKKLMKNTLMWLYVIAKVTEMLDTIFFVLRKKTSQISLLHVYHHTSTFLLGWLVFKVRPEELTFFIIAINSFVHIFMYGYYAMAAMGPKFQKFLWWKKHMTEMQIIQFVAYNIYFTCAKFSNCNYSKGLIDILFANTTILLGLFLAFYLKNYNKRIANKNE